MQLKSGFTLIELLVSIAIIAIIASIGIANLITAQKQARDAARHNLISNTQASFEQYYAELGSYPVGVEATAFESGTLPLDPKNSPPYTISWTVTSDSYCVCATLETGVGNSLDSACTWSSTGSYYCAINKQ